MIRENKLPGTIHERLPLLVDRLKTIDDVNAVFFFGSIAQGALKPLSDVDIAVLLEAGTGKKDALKRELKLAGLLEDVLSTSEFDLVILNTAPLRFAYTILKEGQLVFVRNTDQLIDFREKVVKHYLDFRHYRDQLDREFCKGIGYHG
jgi:predicted nucleotidyltransferase